MKAIVCPECAKDDQIRKVSSIYSEGRTDTVVTGRSTNVNVAAPLKSGNSSYVGVGQSNTTLSGTSQTGLSARLAPPPAPEKQGLGCWWAFIIVGALGFFAPIDSKRKIPMAISFAIFAVFFLLREDRTSSPVLGLIAIGGAISFYIFYILGLIEAGPKIEREHLANMQVWRSKMSRWEKLYYCYRNDVVFDPDSGKSASAGQLGNLLN